MDESHSSIQPGYAWNGYERRQLTLQTMPLMSTVPLIMSSRYSAGWLLTYGLSVANVAGLIPSLQRPDI